jgi:hypothetical protein
MHQRTRSCSLFVSATTLALVVALTATPALAATGSVYFDRNFNTAAGATLFNPTFTGSFNVGVSEFVMTNLTSWWRQQQSRRIRAQERHERQLQRWRGHRCAELQHHRQPQRRRGP